MKPFDKHFFDFSQSPLFFLLVAEFSLLVVAEFLLSLREDDTRSWDNFLVYFSMPCQPKGLGIQFSGLFLNAMPTEGVEDTYL